MKERMKKLLACAGTVGALTIMLSVPVMADTKEDTQSIETQEVQEEAYDWSDKAAAAVNTYANIRSGADINNERVGKLPAGAVVTVEGEENGWMQVSSGDIKGYIRGDLLVQGEDAKELFQSIHGEGEIVGAQPLEVPVQPVVQQNASVLASDADLALMAAIIECEAGGECYEGKIGVGAVVMNRVRSSRFPNTLSEVIYQSGQFTPAATGKLASVLSRGASQACYDAARDVFAGANTIGDRLFFHAGGGSGLTIGNQTFY
nr:cell wall hydrolase [uncultured Blautia sp.]